MLARLLVGEGQVGGHGCELPEQPELCLVPEVDARQRSIAIEDLPFPRANLAEVRHGE